MNQLNPSVWFPFNSTVKLCTSKVTIIQNISTFPCPPLQYGWIHYRKKILRNRHKDVTFLSHFHSYFTKLKNLDGSLIFTPRLVNISRLNQPA